MASSGILSIEIRDILLRELSINASRLYQAASEQCRYGHALKLQSRQVGNLCCIMKCCAMEYAQGRILHASL